MTNFLYLLTLVCFSGLFAAGILGMQTEGIAFALTGLVTGLAGVITDNSER